jgi:hypothetical protein
MKRGAVAGLQKSIWVKPLKDDELELELVPSAGSRIIRSFDLQTDEFTDRVACDKVFVNFKNYFEDDGEVVPNTLENRLQLYGVMHIKEAIKAELINTHHKVVTGEDDADSD